MSQLVVKEVDFQGSSILGAQDSNGKVYICVSYICKGIGLDEYQTKYQRKRIQDDIVLRKGGQNFTLPTNGGIQEVFTIELDFLPLWLAKISITPKMQENNPELVKKLIEYQLKAKDVLAKAFIEEKRSILESYMEMSDEDRAIAYFQAQKQLKLQEPKVDLYDMVMSASNAQEMNTVAKSFKTGRNKLFKILRNNGILMRNNVPYQMYLDQGCFTVIQTTRYIDNEVKVFPKTLVNPRGFELIRSIVREQAMNIIEKAHSNYGMSNKKSTR